MARDIRIHPKLNSSTANDFPRIDFGGLSASTISLKVDDDGSVVYTGTYGVLFNVTDNKDGLLHSVNDVSGLPILQVYSWDYVQMGKWDKYTLVANSDKVGVGLTAPTAKFHIYSTQSGAFRLQDTTQASGYVLVSDANGVGTWTASSNIIGGGGGVTGSGTSSYMTRWETNTQVGSSNIWHNSGGTAIGIGTSSHNGQLVLQFNSNYADGIGVKNISTGSNAITTMAYTSTDGAGVLQVGILGDNNTANTGLGSAKDVFFRQQGPTGSGNMLFGKQGAFATLATYSYSIRFTHGAASGLTFSSMLNMTKATFSATYYHFGFGPGAANYGQTGYIPLGTGSSQARFRHGELSISSNRNSDSSSGYGSAISSIMTAVSRTGGAVTSDFYLDGVGITASEKIWVPDRSAIGYRIDIIGVETPNETISAHTTHVGTIRRPGGGSVVLDADTYTVVNDGFGGVSSQVVADTSNNTLNVRVTGVSG